MVAFAKGDSRKVLGPKVAHEALHSHQDVKREPTDTKTASASVLKAVALQKTDPGVTFVEAIQLEERSRDLAILSEVQAYILQFMLTGGDIPSDTILTIKEAFADRDVSDVEVNSIPLSQYSDSGYVSILSFVLDNVRTYLPKKDQDSDEYLGRIKSASLQIIRLLRQGMNHSQIARSIRESFESIQDGNEWDETKQEYKFLNESISPERQTDDDQLLEWFEKQTEERMTKMRAIALELLQQ